MLKLRGESAAPYEPECKAGCRPVSRLYYPQHDWDNLIDISCPLQLSWRNASINCARVKLRGIVVSFSETNDSSMCGAKFSCFHNTVLINHGGRVRDRCI